MTEQEFYERIEGLCYNIPNRLETPITTAREIVSEFKAYADAQVAEKDAEISRLEAENERLREGIDLLREKSNGVNVEMQVISDGLFALLCDSPAPEKPEEKPVPDILCPKCNSHRVERIGVGINAGTLYKCWECKNEWES